MTKKRSVVAFYIERAILRLADDPKIARRVVAVTPHAARQAGAQLLNAFEEMAMKKQAASIMRRRRRINGT